MFVTLVLLAPAARAAAASCAPRCDHVLCAGAEEEAGLAAATVLSVTPGMYGDYPENPIYDGIEVEVTEMESSDGNRAWIGETFTFQQAGWVETEPGDTLVLWLPHSLQDGSSLVPEIYERDGPVIRCDGGGALVDVVADAPDQSQCLGAFAGNEPQSCDDTPGFGCSASSQPGGWPPLLLALALFPWMRRQSGARA